MQGLKAPLICSHLVGSCELTTWMVVMNEITFALQFILCESKTEARLNRGSTIVLLEYELKF